MNKSSSSQTAATPAVIEFRTLATQPQASKSPAPVFTFVSLAK